MLRQSEKKIPFVTDRASLLGYEGFASKAYFAGIGTLFREPFVFSGRTRRPPRDPINALLSFAYSLLQKNVFSALQLVGFDPCIGFYHEAIYGRPALSLDLMEEFRAVIADSVVMGVINKGMIKIDDFEWNGEACIIKQGARKVFLKAYEKRMNESVTHPVFQYTVTYRRIIELQARFIAKVLRKEIDEYIPFMIR